MHDDIDTRRDRVFKQALEAAAKSAVVWKQQPDNIVALRRVLDTVDRSLDMLLQPVSDQLQSGSAPREKLPPGKTREKDSKESVVPPPAGPVSASTVPPDASDLERREKATFERSYKPVKGIEKEMPQPRSLRNVPLAWVDKKRAAARQVLIELDRALVREERSHQQIGKLLNELRDELEAMSNSPPETPDAGKGGTRRPRNSQ
jgi:hypothetical protein